MATLLRIVLVLTLSWRMAWVVALAQEASDLNAGLLHWWPDPAEGTDAVTGRKGVRQGLGPLPSDPEARFGPIAGWMELGPGITNTTFTVTCWVRWVPADGMPMHGDILTHDSGLGDGWSLTQVPGNKPDAAWTFRGDRDPHLRSALPLDRDWHSIAVRVASGRLELGMDGAWRRFEGEIAMRIPAAAPRLFAGSSALGSTPWSGDLRDLRVYERPLSDAELDGLFQQPRSDARALPVEATIVSPDVVMLHPARDRAYEITHWTPDDGLPSAEVQSLLQVQDGTLWLGFEEGPVRFNGRRFDRVTGTDQDWDTIQMTEHPPGTVWLGLFRGLARLEGQFPPVMFTNFGEARFVQALAPADDEDLWVASVRDEPPRGRPQLWRVRGAERRVEWITELSGRVMKLWQGQGALWIATDEPYAVWRRDSATGLVEMVAHLSLSDGDPLVSSRVTPPCVRVARQWRDPEVQVRVWMEPWPGAQWAEVAVENGSRRFRWRRDSEAAWQFSDVQLTGGDILGAGAPSNWHATTRGLLDFSEGVWTKVPLSLGSGFEGGEINAVIANREGGVWVASKAEGLYLVRKPLVRVLGSGEGLPATDVRSVVARADGRLMIGPTFTQVMFLQPGPMRAASANSQVLPSGTLTSELPDGRLLVGHDVMVGGPQILGSDSQCHLLMVQTNGSPPPLRGVSQVHVSKDGAGWLVADQQVFRIANLPGPAVRGAVPYVEGRDFRVWNPHPDRNLHLVGIAEDAAGRIWVGSGAHGLFRIAGYEVTHFPDPRSPSDRTCVPLGFSTEGTLWLGSEAGLGIWRDEQFHWVRPEDGLPEAVVCDVEEAEGRVWFAGRRGIHAVPRRDIEDFLAGSLLKVSSVSLTRSDGFPRGEANLVHQPGMARSRDGRLWVATTGGLAVFDPREVLATLQPPPVAIDRIVSNGERYPVGSRNVVLPPGGGWGVELGFSSLSFDAPERVAFQYLVTGPGTFIRRETTSPYAVLMHLGPGRYRAEVSARSGHGLVSDPPARLEFEIQPRLTETGWFRVLAGGLSGAMVLGLFTLRIQRIRRTARVEQELRLNTERRRIARDMHDELGSELARMALRLRGGGPDGMADHPADDRQGFRHLLRVLDEIVWVVNPTKDSLESVVGYLEAWVRDFFSETSVVVRTELPPAIPPVTLSSEWRHHLLRIVKESCRNVLQHAGATQVMFTFRLSDGGREVLMELRDDGRGIAGYPASGRPDGGGMGRGGNGLPNLHHRARQLGGTMEVAGAPGEGTCIRLRAPLPEHSDESVTRQATGRI